MTRVLSLLDTIRDGNIWGLEAGCSEDHLSSILDLEQIPIDESGSRVFDFGAVNFFFALDRRDDTRRLLMAKVDIRSCPELFNPWVLRRSSEPSEFEDACRLAAISILRTHRSERAALCEYVFAGGIYVTFNTADSRRGSKGFAGVMLAWDGEMQTKRL